MKLRLNVDGKDYEVEVEVLEEGPGTVPRANLSAPTPAAATPVAPTHSAPPPPTAASGDPDKVFPSPISGVVMRISVQVGQSVQAGDELLVLEAMKMETVITSKSAGKVARINVNEGDAVQVKQPLVEFE